MAVVHNGVIENFLVLKRQLQEEGIVFASDTDTEVIAQLIAYYLEDDLGEAVRKAIGRLKGTYGLAVVSPRHPGLVVTTICAPDFNMFSILRFCRRSAMAGSVRL